MPIDELGLVERFVVVTGPDRVVDAELARMAGVPVSTFPQYEPDMAVPPYTSSIDAALSLVDRMLGVDSHALCYSYDLNYHCYAHAHMAFVATLHLAVGNSADMQTVNAEGASLPLAICRAVLAARQALEDKP